MDLISSLFGRFLCLVSSGQSYLSGNLYGIPGSQKLFWIFLKSLRWQFFPLPHWYNLGVSADYSNNSHLSYNQFDRLDGNIALAQTFLCLWLQQIVAPRAGAQPRLLQALGRLSGEEEAHTHTAPSSSFHSMISPGLGSLEAVNACALLNS